MLIRLLLGAPESAWAHELRAGLASDDRVLTRCDDAPGLWRALRREDFDFVLLDADFLGESPARSIRTIRNLPEHPEVILLTAGEDPALRASLLAAGCLAALPRTLEPGALVRGLDAIFARRRAPAPERAAERLADYAVSSTSMRQVLAVARRLARADSSVLILGETGVGKEWLARAIHAEGSRAAGPFVAVNCGALPEGLLESELFGHERGAFTGAVRSHRGHFETAHRGTIFLDEVVEMPAHVQVKLLRVLQEHVIQRVGAEHPLTVDVRVVAATNRDPSTEIAAGRLRSDLYYRLGVVQLSLPPLRERREDIPTLAESYREQFRLRLGRDVRGFGAGVLGAMARYPWPGNVRELINVVERATLLCPGDTIELADLPAEIAHGGAPAATVPAPLHEGPLPAWREARDAALERFERDYLAALLRASGGRVGEAARRAGLSARGLYGRLRRHGLRKEDFKYLRRTDAGG